MIGYTKTRKFKTIFNYYTKLDHKIAGNQIFSIEIFNNNHTK